MFGIGKLKEKGNGTTSEQRVVQLKDLRCNATEVVASLKQESWWAAFRGTGDRRREIIMRRNSGVGCSRLLCAVVNHILFKWDV